MKTSPNILFGDQPHLARPPVRRPLSSATSPPSKFRTNCSASRGWDDQDVGQRNYSMRIWLDPDKLATPQPDGRRRRQRRHEPERAGGGGQVGQQPVPPGRSSASDGRWAGSTRRGNSATSSSKRGPTARPSQRQLPPARSSTCATSPGSKSGPRTTTRSASLDGQPSAGMAVFQFPGSNALDVAKPSRSRMKELKAVSARARVRIVYDTTPFIRQSIDEVFNTLDRGACWCRRRAVLPAGLEGDDPADDRRAGVAGRHICRHGRAGLQPEQSHAVWPGAGDRDRRGRCDRRAGEHRAADGTGLDARTATIQAMDELTGPIIAITLVLCSVFMPSIFIPGLTGQFYRQFAVTISTAVVISALNAMTLTPSRAVFIFRTEEARRQWRAPRKRPCRGGFLAVSVGS